MNTKLHRIKAALRESIEIAEKATEGPWEVDSANGVHAIGVGWTPICYPFGDKDTELKDATFIAHARTMTPLACKSLLLAIEGLEELREYFDISEPFRENLAEKHLESITSEWPDV